MLFSGPVAYQNLWTPRPIFLLASRSAFWVHSLSFSPRLGMLAAAEGIDLTSGLLDCRAKDDRGMKDRLISILPVGKNFQKATECATWQGFSSVEIVLALLHDSNWHSYCQYVAQRFGFPDVVARVLHSLVQRCDEKRLPAMHVFAWCHRSDLAALGFLYKDNLPKEIQDQLQHPQGALLGDGLAACMINLHMLAFFSDFIPFLMEGGLDLLDKLMYQVFCGELGDRLALQKAFLNGIADSAKKHLQHDHDLTPLRSTLHRVLEDMLSPLHVGSSGNLESHFGIIADLLFQVVDEHVDEDLP
eukprot:symbB.v1.2.037498.t2/scaffold5556.1/size26356/3